MLKGKLQSELFYCNHLGVSENDERDIRKGNQKTTRK